MIDKKISVMEHGTLLSGTVKGVSRDGGLVLQSNGNERTLFAGDVTILAE